MPVTIAESRHQRLTDRDLDAWRDIPATVACDALGRTGGMTAAIQSLSPGVGFIGQALTVHAPKASNAAIHHAVKEAWPGCVLVVDADAVEEKAIWGSVIGAYAQSLGVAALVVDGCVRDAAILKRSGLPIFCRGTAPSGPSKEDVGSILAPITCGGVSVSSGDLVIGDDDGVAVVPFAEMGPALEKCRARLDQKMDWNAQTREGVSTASLWNLPAPGKK